MLEIQGRERVVLKEIVEEECVYVLQGAVKGDLYAFLAKLLQLRLVEL